MIDDDSEMDVVAPKDYLNEITAESRVDRPFKESKEAWNRKSSYYFDKNAGKFWGHLPEGEGEELFDSDGDEVQVKPTKEKPIKFTKTEKIYKQADKSLPKMQPLQVPNYLANPKRALREDKLS